MTPSKAKARITELQRRIDAANGANVKRRSALKDANATEKKSLTRKIDAANEKNAKRRARIADLKKVIASK